ncbi:MAG: hypothetical protein WCD00_02540 [Desulfuromonadaceae bacterium]
MAGSFFNNLLAEGAIMRAMLVFMGIMLMLAKSETSFSADLESLKSEGYEVVEETKVVGQFKGCDAKTALAFTNGKVFVCSTYAYSYAVYMPVAYILENKSKEIKVLINGTAYSGSFIEQGKNPARTP